MNWEYSCKKVAELLSQGLDEPLEWSDRVRLRIHIAMCGNCRNAEQQLHAVVAASRRLFGGEADRPHDAGDGD